MLAKGIITAIEPNNKYSVRIPLFETAGSPDQIIIKGILCYQPGNINAYNVNDRVIIGFENDEITHPIIIGKLFTGPEETATNFANCESIKVTGKADLPVGTTIGGVNLSELFNKLLNSGDKSITLPIDLEQYVTKDSLDSSLESLTTKILNTVIKDVVVEPEENVLVSNNKLFKINNVILGSINISNSLSEAILQGTDIATIDDLTDVDLYVGQYYKISYSRTASPHYTYQGSGTFIIRNGVLSFPDEALPGWSRTGSILSFELRFN